MSAPEIPRLLRALILDGAAPYSALTLGTCLPDHHDGWVAGSGASGLEVFTAALARASFVLGAGSLTWQGVTWRLGGIRVRAKVLKGAIHEHSLAYGTLPAKRSWAEMEANFTGQGFTRKALYLRVINKGRQPVQVERWCVLFPNKIRVGELRSTLGPPLPDRLEVGASQVWGIELET